MLLRLKNVPPLPAFLLTTGLFDSMPFDPVSKIAVSFCMMIVLIIWLIAGSRKTKEQEPAE
jgi:hypothetical protein